MARGKGGKKRNNTSRFNRTPVAASGGGRGEHEVTASSLPQSSHTSLDTESVHDSSSSVQPDQNLKSNFTELDSSSYDNSTVMLECENAQTEFRQKSEPTRPKTGGVKGQGVGDRRKSGLARKNESSTERNDDRVRDYWKTMSLDMKRDLVQINISDLKAHIKLLKDKSECEVFEEALEFFKSNSCWTYWMCCQCDEKFPDSHSHMQHVIQEHIGNLQELLYSCGLARDEENDNFKDELSSSGIVETPEKIDFNEDESCLLLDESSLPSKLPPSISNDTLNGKVSATTADIGCKDGANLDDNAFLSWILSGPGEMCPREEKAYQAIEIFQMLEKEFNQLLILSQRKSEHLCYKNALQRVENLCPEEGKKEEHMPEFDGRSYESVLRKQRVELIKTENASTHIFDRFELDAISIVLKEAEYVDVDQCGVKETYDGEKDERKAKNYLHQPEICIKSVIKKQKEKLNIEIDDIKRRILQHVAVWEEWKNKLNPESFHDYRSIVVPLLKSFLRAHLEALAEKDAKKKSDAAYEQFLQDLESEKGDGGGVTNSGHQNQKSNSKKKKKCFKKNKDSKQVAGSNKLHTISGAAEKISFPSVEADAAEKDDTCNQQEEEFRGRVELGAGEGMLKERLEFYEEENHDLQGGQFTTVRYKKPGGTEQRGRKTTDIRGRGISEDAFPPISDQKNGRKGKKNEKLSKDNGNKHQPISIEKENTEAGQATSSGSLKVPPEQLYATQLSQLQEMGFFDTQENIRALGATSGNVQAALERLLGKLGDIADRGISRDNFSPLSDQKNGRSGKKNEKSSKDNGNKHQPISIEKENTEARQATSSGSLKGKLNQLEASLMASTLEMPEKVFVKGEELSNESTDHGINNVDGADVHGTGLINKIGENNCFLNVIIQSLWNLRRFRDEFLNCPTDHVHQGDPNCVICALHGIFVALRNAKHGEPADPTFLRIALSDSSSDREFFQKGQKNDATELLAAILNFIHKSSSSNFDISDTDTDTDTEKINPLGSWDCADSDCIAHSLFGMDVYKHMYCYHCSLESRHEKHSSFSHDVNACYLRTIKAKHPECSFDQLLCLVEMEVDVEVSCPLEKGGCNEKGKIQKYILAPPYIFTIVLGWENYREDAKDIAETFEALAVEIDISVFYRGLDSQNIHCLASVVCFYGDHFICFVKNEKEEWILYNDEIVEVIGSWEDVCTRCRSEPFQPQVLLYEASN